MTADTSGLEALRVHYEDRAIGLVRPELEKARLERDVAKAETATAKAELSGKDAQIRDLEARLKYAEADAKEEGNGRSAAEKREESLLARLAMAEEAETRRHEEMCASHEREMKLLRDGYKAVERRHADILDKLDKLLQLELKDAAPTASAPPPMYARIEAVRDGNGLVRAWKFIPKE